MSFFSKIFEKTMYNCFVKFIDKYAIIYKFQQISQTTIYTLTRNIIPKMCYLWCSTGYTIWATTIYINDMTNVSNKICTEMFSDDSTVLIEGDNPDAVIISLNSELDNRNTCLTTVLWSRG